LPATAFIHYHPLTSRGGAAWGKPRRLGFFSRSVIGPQGTAALISCPRHDCRRIAFFDVITLAPMGFTMATFIMNVEPGKNSTARYDQ